MTDTKNIEITTTSDNSKETPTLSMQRGRTTFMIGLHFAEKGKETLDDKVKRLISKDVQSENF